MPSPPSASTRTDLRTCFRGAIWLYVALLSLGWPSSAQAHPNGFISNIDLNIRITENAVIFDLDIATFLFPPLEDVQFGRVAPRPTAPDRAEEMERYIAEKCSVHVDGVLVKPKLTELVFDDNPQGVHLNKTRPMVHAFTSFSYPLKSKPREVRMKWGIFLEIPDSFYETLTQPELLGEDLSELNPQLDAYGKWQTAYFATIEPEYIWHSPEFRSAPPLNLKASAASGSTGAGGAGEWHLPLLSGALGLGLLVFLIISLTKRLKPVLVLSVLVVGATAAYFTRGLLPISLGNLVQDSQVVMPDEAGAVELFKTLHGNIYRAFDYDQETDIYDALAQSVSGDLLEQIYNDVYQNLIMRDEGGAVAKVSKVDVLECQATEVDSKDGEGGNDSADGAFEIDCLWRVHGMVTHNGHTHRRINEYRATYGMAPRNGLWKITDSRVGDQKRVYSRDLRKAVEERVAQAGIEGGPDKAAVDPNNPPAKEGDKDPDNISSLEIQELFIQRLNELFQGMNEQGPKAREAALLRLVEDSLVTNVEMELLERIRAEEEDERESTFLATAAPVLQSCRVFEITREAETRFQIICGWTISGTLEVETVKRKALHLFEANFELAYRDLRWKITDLQIDRHEKLDPENPPVPSPSEDESSKPPAPSAPFLSPDSNSDSDSGSDSDPADLPDVPIDADSPAPPADSDPES